ncbi:MAG TPA: glycosyltransferase [Pirellulales bacterium]|nr:glycosyltransferase [Pirellulales bacterium]
MTAVDDAWLRLKRSGCARAWLMWAVLSAVIVALVIAWPESRTVTPNYREACLRWFAGQDIYCNGPHGFLYFPQAAVLFAPFAYLPLGDALWRVVGIGGLALAVRRFSGLVSSGNRASAFAWMTAVAIPPALASARNGQMNLVLASAMTFAMAALAGRRWNQAAFWLCFGVAMKPLMAVPIAVAICCYRPVRKPLAIGLLLVAAVPFAMQAPAYAVRQHQLCFEKLFLAVAPGPENPASDLFGLVSSIGYDFPAGLQTVIRGVAGIALLLLCGAAVRRRSPRSASAIILTFLAAYLTLFNPRTENNGYVVLAPALGAWAAWGLRGGRQRRVGWLMWIVAWGIAGSYELTGGPNFWLNPLLCFAPLSCAVASILGRPNRRGWSAAFRPPVRPALAQAVALPPAIGEAGLYDHDLTVVIPAFNEQHRLPRTLRILVDWLDKWGIDYRVLVVDDGSDDETLAVSSTFGPRVETLKLARQGGKGRAVKRGMMAARGRVVAYTDADLPYCLGALRGAYERIAAGRCSAAFGARDLPGSANRVAPALSRRLASAAFRLLTTRLISRQIPDTQCGLKVFSASAARQVFSRTTIAGFAFDVEVVWLCHRLRLDVERVPVTLMNDYDSSLSVTRHGASMLVDVLKLRFLQRGSFASTRMDRDNSVKSQQDQANSLMGNLTI